MISSAIWFIVWAAAILTSIVTLELIVKNGDADDVQVWCFWLCPVLWAAIAVFWFH